MDGILFGGDPDAVKKDGLAPPLVFPRTDSGGATHHLFRIIVLLLLLPVLFKIFGQIQADALVKGEEPLHGP